MTKRAVLYARVSTEKQEDGTSLDGQMTRMRQYAQGRGYTVIEEIRESHTGTDPNRPGLNQLRALTRARQVDVIVVYAMDRFMRDATQSVIVEHELEREGAVIEYMDLPDPDTGMAYRMTKAMLREVAQAENERRAERTIRGQRDRARQGSVLVAGNAPYGYDTRRNGHLFELVIVEEEARIVRQIFDWYTRGDGERRPLAMRAIAHRLTELHVPTKRDRTNRGGKTVAGWGVWSAPAVGKILKNETYAGVFHFGKCARKTGPQPRDTWIPVDVPPIVDRATWRAAQERRRENKGRSPRNTKRQYLLRRRVTCACGYSMGGAPVSNLRYGSLHLYYRCPADRRHELHPCRAPRFRVDHVDATVWAWLYELLTDERALTRKAEESRAAQERKLQPLRERATIVDDLLAKNRQDMQKLLDLYLAGDFDRELLLERKAKLDKAIADLEAERGNLAALLSDQTFTVEQVQTLHDLAATVREGLADPDFAFQEQIVDLLDVHARLCVEDGIKVAYVQCRVDAARLPIVSTGCRHRCFRGQHGWGRQSPGPSRAG